MRPVCICALLLAASAAAANPPLTIVLDFQGPHSSRSVDAMKHEIEALMQPSGIKFNWRLRGELGEAAVDNLIVVRFKGKCVLEPVGYLYDERGPLAFTYSTAGEVQPYSEVPCDKVTAAVRSAMAGADFARADLLLGRALGRVVAHEMAHMLAKSGAHSHDGFTKPALSGKSLIARERP